MPEMQQLADAMLAAAGTVLGQLVEQPATAGGTVRNDHDGSIRTDGEELVTVAQIPSIGAQIVVRFAKTDMQQIVAIMFGGSEDLAAMVEQIARELDVSAEGIRATLCGDAALLPPRVCVDFAAITLSKLAPVTASEAYVESAPEPSAVAARPKTVAAASAQSVAFTPLQPTPVRPAKSGQADLDLVHDVPLQISAVLGKTAMPLREVVSLQSGTVFELDKLAIEPIDLYVNNILIAHGEVVVVEDKYAVKISELNPQIG